MNPLALSDMTGLPKGGKHQRGARKRSGNPGSRHLDALTKAHGKDHKTARDAALNYAKEITKHMSTGDAESGAQAADIGPSAPAPSAPKASDARARLAKLAMSKRK